MEQHNRSRIQFLPCEILHNILSRLPLPSLVQAKCVCKAWNSVVQDPHFIRLHLSRSVEYDPCVLLHHFANAAPSEMYLADLSDQNKIDFPVKRISSPMLSRFKVVGSCNGLLCLYDSEQRNSVCICNPFIGNHPESHQLFACPGQAFGFGFNPTTNEFKVVVSAAIGDKHVISFPGNPNSPVSDVNVLTLGTRNWRTIEQVPYHFGQSSLQILLVGKLHWSALRQDYNGRAIVSFDLENEQFLEIPKPACGSLDRSWYHLVELGGFLCAVMLCVDGSFKIWKMRAYGDKESWVNEFNIGSYLPQELDRVTRLRTRGSYGFNTRVLCLLKTGEVLLHYGLKELVCYNPKHGTFRNLVLQGTPRWFETIAHVCSLCQIHAVINP